jgi:hypothetical protein
LELPFHWCEIGVVLLADRGPHRMHEHPVAVSTVATMRAATSSCAAKISDVLEVAIVGLGPELRSRLGVDKLSAHANAGASFADASFQHVTRAEFGAEGTSRLQSLPSVALPTRSRRPTDTETAKAQS